MLAWQAQDPVTPEPDSSWRTPRVGPDSAAGDTVLWSREAHDLYKIIQQVSRSQDLES